MNQNPNLYEAVKHGSVMFPLEYYHCVFPLGISNLPVHWHKEFEITLVQKGSCTYQIDLQTYEIKEGDILLLPPEMLHGTGEEPKEEFITDSFVFCLDMLESQRTDSCTTKFFAPLTKGTLRFPVYLPAADSMALLLGKSFEKIRKTFLEKPSGYELEIKSELFHLFFLLYRQVPYQRSDQEHTEITDKLKVVLQFIQDHYQKGITVQELADLCHFSEYHFMRFFKRHMNMTSIEYLNQYRLEMASRQLAETNLSVTSIALESGFNNISYFNRVFKRKFGVTPMEYRSSKPHSEITYAQHQMINTGKEQVASDDISHREKREDRIEDHKEAHHQSKDINDQ